MTIMKKYLLLSFLFIVGNLSAQVTFILDSIPAYTPPADIIYIAGNFNSWEPGDPAYALVKGADQKWTYISAVAPEGTIIQYKFTRGTWETVEKGANGEEIANRTFTFGNGDTVHAIIYNWAQAAPPASTAAENVAIMSDNFDMPQLDTIRQIWIYYPPDYETSGLDYPVLYMHDGQNLFDDSTSYAGEWHVDETLNDLYQQGFKVPIVIGIEHGGDKRLAELTPWPHVGYGGGDGDLYMEFIVETLKPYVDAHYRTLTEREYTGIMGSSLGGLVTHYGALKYQEVFSKAGVYSPSFWFSDSVWSFTREMGHRDAMRVYMMCGGAEGQGTINDMTDMQDSLLANGFSEDELSLTVIPGGQHNETLWSSDFGNAYKWLFASYTNEIKEPVKNNIIRLFPNPAGNILTLPEDFPGRCDSLEVVGMDGAIVLIISPFSGKQVDISKLPPGLYLVSVNVSGKYYQGKVIKK
jgi:predicted alpha/beta superfamily hydrolase